MFVLKPQKPSWQNVVTFKGNKCPPMLQKEANEVSFPLKDGVLENASIAVERRFSHLQQNRSDLLF